MVFVFLEDDEFYPLSPQQVVVVWADHGRIILEPGERLEIWAAFSGSGMTVGVRQPGVMSTGPA